MARIPELTVGSLAPEFPTPKHCPILNPAHSWTECSVLQRRTTELGGILNTFELYMEIGYSHQSSNNSISSQVNNSVMMCFSGTGRRPKLNDWTQVHTRSTCPHDHLDQLLHSSPLWPPSLSYLITFSHSAVIEGSRKTSTKSHKQICPLTSSLLSFLQKSLFKLLHPTPPTPRIHSLWDQIEFITRFIHFCAFSLFSPT